jgi:tetratricopeptide (TPR) repeat protein
LAREFVAATRLHEAGDLLGAIRGYEEILASHPNRVDVRSNLAAAYSGLGRYEEAIDHYNRALQLDPRNITVRFNFAKAYYKAALFPEAAAELERVLTTAPSNLPGRKDAIIILADCNVRLGRYRNAIESLTPLSDADPKDRMIAYLLGSALISAGERQKGQELIDRVFRGEDSAQARLLIGSILLIADNGHAALEELKRAIELDPKLPTLHSWYGRVLMRMGDPDKARTAFRTELASNPNDFEAHLYLGILLKRDRLFVEAEKYLDRAVKLRPGDSYARYHLGAVNASQGKPQEALPYLESVVKDFPSFTEARVLLASVYYRLNRKADGDEQRAIIQKLNAEEQANQPGTQGAGAGNAAPRKPDTEPQRQQNPAGGGSKLP